MRKEKIKRFFISTCFYLLALFPFLLAAISALRYFVNYQRFKIFSLLLIIFFTWVLANLLSKNWRFKIREIVFLISLFALTILVRYISQVLIKTQPTADFANALVIAEKFSKGFFADLRSARFPYWGFYKLTLSPFIKIFDCPLAFTKTLNLILSGLTTIGIYFLGKTASASKRFALTSSMVYVFFPADILYKNLPTGEHIFIMLLPFTLILFSSLLKKINDNWINLLLLFFFGALLGLMDLYRPVALILLIASLLSIVLFNMFSIHYNKFFLGDIRFWQNFLIILLITLGFFSAKAIGFNAIRQKTGYEPNRSGLGWTLRIGLDLEEGGTWNRKIYDQMINLYVENDENYEKVNQILLAETKAILQEDRSEIFGFLVHKFNFTWKSNYDFFHWATIARTAAGQSTLTSQQLGTYLLPLSEIYWIFILSFSCLGSIYCAKNHQSLILFVIALFIVGIGFLFLIIETQQRYLSVLHSFLPILTTYGLLNFNNLIKKIINRTFFK
jgi:hypothetical protein